MIFGLNYFVGADDARGKRPPLKKKSPSEDHSKSPIDEGQGALESAHAIEGVIDALTRDLYEHLSIISHAVEMAKRKPEMSDRLLRIVEGRARRAFSVIEEIRDATINVRPRPANTNLASLIREAVEEARVPKSVNLELDLRPGLCSIGLDPVIVRKVLGNLITNALEAMPNGGGLALRAETDDHEMVMSVKDTGGGMPNDVAARIFEPFYTTKAHRLGLGLTYCRRAIEAHGGSITFKTRLGEGTTFTVTLPRRWSGG